MARAEGAPAFTLNQLAAFVAVAEAGTISAAAEKLHSSPSALSAAVTELERALQAQLLRRRTAKGVSLTPTGEAVPEVEPLLAERDPAVMAHRIFAVHERSHRAHPRLDHRLDRRSSMTTVTVPEGSLFGPANLPYGVYSVAGSTPRVATRLGDTVVDLAVLLGDEVFAAPTLNPFMAEGHARWVAVREDIAERVSGDVPDEALHDLADVTLHLPIDVADYVDFYASEHHAANLGRLFRPDSPDPLTPNWKHLPIGYHGRASSIVVSGTDIVRPCGQRKGPDDPAPVFGPSVRLDIEAELGFLVGTGSAMGDRIPVDEVERHLFGVVVFNDWSARDIQAWEYVPLGPNLGKSFASTISPWVVPLLALQAAKVPTPVQDPQPLPYLSMDRPWGLDVDLSVRWNGQEVSRPPYRDMYWSPAQMLAHLTVNGAPSRTGDVFASGTISGPGKETRGAFIELTWGGTQPVTVGGEQRTFLEDGDEVVITASAPGPDGTRLGFGEARGRILPARSTPAGGS